MGYSMNNWGIIGVSVKTPNLAGVHVRLISP